MNRKRISVLVLSAAAAVALYALAGFLILPHVAKSRLIAHVEQELGHRLALGAVRLNPFTLRLELADIELSEPDGGPLFTATRLAADLEAASLWRRAWSLAFIEAQAPHLNFELRPGGRHNFSALLDALRTPKPQPSGPLPALAIGRITIADGRIDLADTQAGEAARLTLAPIAFELTELTTEVSDTAPYKLTARSADGERIEWRGEVSLNPAQSNGHVSLQGWNVPTLVRLLGNRLELQRSAGTIDLSLDYRAGYESGTSTLAVSNLTASIAGLALQDRDAADPFVAFERLQLSDGTLDPLARKFSIDRIELTRASVALAIGADGTPNWARIAQPAAIDSPAAATSVPAPAAQPAPMAAAEPAQPWDGRLGRLVVTDSSLSLADRRAAGTSIALAGIRLELGAALAHSPASTALDIVQVKGAIARLSAGTGAQRFEATDSILDAAAIGVKLVGATLEASVQALGAQLAAAGMRQGNDEWRAEKLALSAESVRLGSGAEPGTRAQAAALAIDAAGIAGRVGKDAQNALEAASASVRVQAAALDPGSGSVRLDGAGGSVDTLVVRDPASGGTLARLARAEITGAALAAAERRIGVDAITLTDAHASAIVAPDGKTNWDGLLAAFGGEPTQPAGKVQPAPATAPWNAVVRTVELRKAGGSFSDRRHDPPLAIELTQVSARARNAGTERKRPMRVELAGRINGGGQFNAAGRVDLQALAADLNVKLGGISLLPLQPFLARHARVQVVSALASADGRLRYNMAKAAGANLVFEGTLGLDKVIVEETEPAQPLLSVESLRASETKLTLGPDRLEIPDLRLQSLVTRLLIAEDQSVNIAKLLRRPQPEPAAAKPQPSATKPQSAATKPGPAAAKPGPPAAAEADDVFPIVVSRVRLDNSVLEFSDLSLRPQFNTRMHELQGVITGISTSPDTRARMELEARVDEFGSARIEGVMNLFQPRVFTDVTMVFRNLEMTDLTPYAAKFAGYRIASGKLSMDLHYRIRKSALVGENKIVVDKLVLGERVESPSALDLPLELAIAILQDENGRIDIGLPVSGSLEDPQFNIAGIVWKAIGSLLGRVVSAPFRALARLFGGGAGAEDLDSIEFAAGAARLAPPERQKLETVATALAKRPELKVIVKPGYAPEGDREALQSAAVRRDVLTRAGVKLAPGEAPGPLDYGNARVRQAIEDLFTDAFGFPAARDLRAELAKSARKPQAEAPTPAAGNGEGAKPQSPAPAAGNVRIARAMTQRLMAARTVSEAELSALAQARAEAVTQALRDSAKVDPARIATAAPRAIAGDADRSVPTSLELGLAK